MNAAIFCLSVLAVAAIGRWALKQIRRGVKLRAEAVVEWQDCDRQPRRTDDEMAVADATKLDHFAVWEAELAGEKEIRKHLRRMDRWSS